MKIKNKLEKNFASEKLYLKKVKKEKEWFLGQISPRVKTSQRNLLLKNDNVVSVIVEFTKLKPEMGPIA